MPRYFQVISVTKTAQKNVHTKFDGTKLYSGSPVSAAKKGFYNTCKQINKGIKNRCTLSVTVMEVKKRMIDGISTIQTVQDSNGKYKIYKYALKLKRYSTTPGEGKTVTFGEKSIVFQYYPDIVESFGRLD